VQDHDGPLVAHRAHRILEPHRFGHGFGHEALDDRRLPSVFRSPRSPSSLQCHPKAGVQ
jgi:hypothetical protein